MRSMRGEGEGRSVRPGAASDDIAAVAHALKADYGDLLRGECSFRETTEQLRAMAALDAARERLQGGTRRDATQLALDLRSS